MRVLIVVAVASLALAACGSKQETANTANVDEQLAFENVATNDVTAIDAATGEDANMAADANVLLEEVNNLSSNNEATARNTQTRRSDTPRPRTSPSPESNTAEPVANATANNAL